MSLFDMIMQHGGVDALTRIGARVGLTPDQVRAAASSLAPSLAPAIEQQAGAGALTDVHATPPAPGTDAATDHGNGVLASILGSKDASRAAAAGASADTGISVDKIKAVLPQLAGIAAAAFLAHKASQAGAFGQH